MNMNRPNVYLFNFSFWKRDYIKIFLNINNFGKTFFCKKMEEATKKGLSEKDIILVWGKYILRKEDESFLKTKQIPVYHIEDGFIRSVHIGAAHHLPYSLIIDKQGIYFDPNAKSDLEDIFNFFDFNKDPTLLERALKVKEKILSLKISKYNHFPHQKLNIHKDKYDKVILIPGQVIDDASVKYGGFNMSNESLLVQVRNENPNAFIIYKIHPDVLANYRNDGIDSLNALKYCNMIAENISIGSCIDEADEIHTISSLCGFEALLKCKKVFTYGMPFYAGWGLTTDKRYCSRRTRKLTLNEMIAGALILYPSYFNPKTKRKATVEEVIDIISNEQSLYFKSKFYRLYSFICWLIKRNTVRISEIIYNLNP